MAKAKIRSLGLDLSLTKTGVVVLENNKILYSDIIKSQPSGDKPIDELIRLVLISAKATEVINKYNPNIVVIENLAFLAQGTSLTQLAGLSYMVRAYLADRRIPFIMVAPTSLKKFITGSGKGEKDTMMLEVYKRYGVSIPENNINDAFGLAKIGQLMIKDDPKIPIFQKEVINLLKNQWPAIKK